MKDLNENYKIIYQKKGHKPLCYYNKDLMTFSKGSLWTFNIKEKEWKKKYSFKYSLLSRVLLRFRLPTRFLRLEPRDAIQISDNEVVLSVKGNLLLIDLEKKQEQIIFTYKEGMNNPLRLTYINKMKNFKEGVYFGDYFSNERLESVNLYFFDVVEKEVSKIYEFPNGTMNHIHSIVPNYFKNEVYINSGDNDSGTGIWITNNGFKTLNKYKIGKQKYRTCNLFVDKEELIYATDSPMNPNNLYKLVGDKETTMFDLSGTTIYSSIFKKGYIFSTAVEGVPYIKNKIKRLISNKLGEGITSNKSIIYYYHNGKLIKLISAKKDWVPFMVGQFGTFMFPNQHNSDPNLIIAYGIALKKYDGKLIIIKEV